MRALILGLAGTALAWVAPAAGQPTATPAAAPAPVRVVFVDGEVKNAPDDPAWERIPETQIALLEQLINPPVGGGSVANVGVRAMHDGAWLAIRLEWADARADRAVGVDTFRDAAAVGFPLGQKETPTSPFMGDAEHPVAIWQWTADFDANARSQGAFAERYPHTEGVWYFPQDAAFGRQVRAWRGTEPVVAYTAHGFGSLTHHPGARVAGSSTHAGDRWRVVLLRQLSTGTPEEVSFKPGESTQMIVAVWNGSQAEVNGRKSVTMAWTPFALDATVGGDGKP